jgi:prevent-host-death family protein
MGEASVRDLRNHGGRVIDRVIAGERVTITKGGVPVAELIPIRRRPLSAAEIVARAKHLPAMDPQKLRDDIDELFDTRLFPDRP